MCTVDIFQHISLLHPKPIYLYSYPKDVFAACFLHTFVKDVCSGYFPTHLCELSISHTPMLKRCVLCTGLNIDFKDVHTGQLLEICPKEVLTGYFCLYIYLKDVHTRHLPTHLH